MDLRHVIAFVRRWYQLLGLFAVLGGVAGFGVSSFLPKVYEARTTLIVGEALSAANPDFVQLQASELLAGTYAAVATSRPTLAKVIDRLAIDETPDDLAQQVQASAPVGSTVLLISARSGDPNRAASIANAIAAELIATSPVADPNYVALQQLIQTQLTAVNVQIAAAETEYQALASDPERTPAEEAAFVAVQDRLATLRSTFATLVSSSTSKPANQLTVIEPAFASSSPVSPRVLINTLLATAMGLLLAGAIAFGIDAYQPAPAIAPSRRVRRLRDETA